MDRNFRWAWFALACFVVLLLLWLGRYQYTGCDLDGCVVIDRWTGEIFFEPLGEEEPATTGAVVVMESPGGTPGY